MAKFKDTFELVDKVSKPLLKMSRNFANLDKSIAKSEKRLERFKKQPENIAKIGNKVKKRIAIDETAVPIVKECFQMLLNNIEIVESQSSKESFMIRIFLSSMTTEIQIYMLFLLPVYHTNSL